MKRNVRAIRLFWQWFVVAVFVSRCGAPVHCCGQNQDSVRLRVGRALRLALETKGSLTVNPASLKNITAGIQQQTGIPILIDRRIDPSTKVVFSATDTEFEQILRGISESIQGCNLAVTDRLVVIAPSEAAQRLESLLDSNRRQCSDARKSHPNLDYRKLTGIQEAGWPRLAEPRELVVRAAEQAGLTVQNPEAVPHDVWDKSALPRMAFSDLVTVILNEFDLTFQFADEDASIVIIPVSEGGNSSGN